MNREPEALGAGLLHQGRMGFACAMAREAPNGPQRCQWTPVML